MSQVQKNEILLKKILKYVEVNILYIWNIALQKHNIDIILTLK